MLSPKEFAARFFAEMAQPPLLHGDEDHKAWLTVELYKHQSRLEHELTVYIANVSREA